MKRKEQLAEEGVSHVSEDKVKQRGHLVPVGDDVLAGPYAMRCRCMHGLVVQVLAGNLLVVVLHACHQWLADVLVTS